MKPVIIKNNRLWTRDFILIISLNLLGYIIIYILMSAMPLYIQHVGGNKLLAGLTSSLFTLGGFLARPWIGGLLDRKGRKRIMLLGSIFLLIPVVGYIFINSPIMILILRMIQGMTFSAVSTAAITIASDLIPAARRYEGVGYFGVSNAAAMAIGPAVGLYSVEYFDYHTLYLLTAFLVIVVIILGAFAKKDDPDEYRFKEYHQCQEAAENPAAENPAAGNYARQAPEKQYQLFEKTALIPSLIYFLVSLTAAVIVTFIPSYEVSKGISNIGLFYVVYAVLLLVTRPTTGKIADRFGPGKVILPGLTAIIAAFFLLSQASTVTAFLIAAAFYGLGMGAVLPVLNTLVINFAPPERRGAANATYLAANDIGSAVGAAMWGIIAQQFDYGYIYLLSPFFIFSAVLVYFLALRRKIR